jgi:hypothetical protein
MKVEKFTRWVPQRSASDWWVFSFYSRQSLFCGCQLVPTFGALTPIYWIYYGCILISVASISFSDLHDKLRLKGQSQSLWIGLSIQHITHSPPEKPVVHPYKLLRSWLPGCPLHKNLKHPTWAASGSWRDHLQRKSFFFCPGGSWHLGPNLSKLQSYPNPMQTCLCQNIPQTRPQACPTWLFSQIPNWRQNHPKLQGLTPQTIGKL